MKVISASEMSRLEREAFDDGASDHTFMESAGMGVAHQLQKFIVEQDLSHFVVLLCGKGNNAGDAYVAGFFLMEQGYRVQAIQLFPVSGCSPLCQQNHDRFVEAGGQVQVAANGEVSFPESGVILDGILGTGFRGKVREPLAGVIRAANDSGLPIVAIDIPSGISGNDGKGDGEAIQAELTTFLGAPKTGFFLKGAWDHVGHLAHVDFGLEEKYVDRAREDLILGHDHFKLPPLCRSQHKYQAGYVVGLAGSPGMPGAAILSSMSALKSGAGIVRLLHPASMAGEFAAAPLELVRDSFREIEEHLEPFQKASAIFLGPGMGRGPEVYQILNIILPLLKKPLVVDADAITVLSELDSALIPEGCILTPHVGEAHRLLGLKERHPLDLDFLAQCQEFVSKHRVHMVLKGGPTFVISPGKTIWVSPWGTPGLATAGTGDVLTGVIAAFLAQGVSPAEAAKMAVFIHAKAGERLACRQPPRTMIASDVMLELPETLKMVESRYV